MLCKWAKYGNFSINTELVEIMMLDKNAIRFSLNSGVEIPMYFDDEVEAEEAYVLITEDFNALDVPERMRAKSGNYIGEDDELDPLPV